jgi:hypothetical protein
MSFGGLLGGGWAFEKTKSPTIYGHGASVIIPKVAIAFFQIPRVVAIIVGGVVGSILGLGYGLWQLPSIIRNKLQNRAPSPSGERVKNMLQTQKSGGWNSDWYTETINIQYDTRSDLGAKLKEQTKLKEQLRSNIIKTAIDVSGLPEKGSIPDLKLEITYYLEVLKTKLNDVDSTLPNDDLNLYKLKLQTYRGRHHIKQDQYNKMLADYKNIDASHKELNTIVTNLAACKSEKDVTVQVERLKKLVNSENMKSLAVPAYVKKDKLDGTTPLQNTLLNMKPNSTNAVPPSTNNTVTNTAGSKKKSLFER